MSTTDMLDCHSFCGPSFKLRHQAPLFKARKRLNTWLATDESDKDDYDDKSAPVVALKSLPPVACQAAITTGSSAANSSSSESAAEFCNASKLLSTGRQRTIRHEAFQTERDPISDQEPSQPCQVQQGSLGHLRKAVEKTRRQQMVNTMKANEQRISQAVNELQIQPEHRTDARIAYYNYANNEKPIDYMEVYHRLRMGRFVNPRSLPSVKASSACTRADSHRRPLGLPNRCSQNDAGSMSTTTVSSSAAGRPAHDGALRLSWSEDGTQLGDLLRLLRDDRRRSGEDTDENTVVPQSSPPLPPWSSNCQIRPPPPVLKSRLSLRRKSTSRRVATLAPAASSPRSGELSGARQAQLSSRLVSGPFSSSAVGVVTPFGPPRRRSLLPTLVTSVVEPAPLGTGWQLLVYRCADWWVQRRLSVTSRLLSERDGDAPCRWLGSSALLTQLRLPQRVELPGRVQSSSPSTAVVARIRPSGGLCTARCVDSPATRFAFHAMNKHCSSRCRRKGRSSLRKGATSGKQTGNIYAVPVSS